MSSRPGSGGPKLRRLNMGQVFIVLAVVSAVLTIFVFKSLMSGKAPDKAVAETKTRPLVVATHQLFSGEILTADSVKIVDWPQDHYPESDVYEQSDKIIGRAVKQNIYPGEPLYKQNVAGEDSAGGLPVVIPQGQRAMTILVTENKGVGGFIKPGDHVDIIGTFEYHFPEATQKAFASKGGALLEDSFHISQTVMQDVQVLAIAQEMYEKKNVLAEGISQQPATTQASAAPAASESSSSTSSPAPAANAGEATKGKIVSSVTVSVTPEQAEKLAYADSRGDLRLTLRPDSEHEQVHLLGAVGQDVVPISNIFDKIQKVGADFGSSFMGGGDMPPPPPPSQVASTPPAMPVEPIHNGHDIQLIQGTETSNVSF